MKDSHKSGDSGGAADRPILASMDLSPTTLLVHAADTAWGDLIGELQAAQLPVQPVPKCCSVCVRTRPAKVAVKAQAVETAAAAVALTGTLWAPPEAADTEAPVATKQAASQKPEWEAHHTVRTRLSRRSSWDPAAAPVMMSPAAEQEGTAETAAESSWRS